MKPLQIELSAFGSYPGRHSVDFTTLAPRGLFVVTGDTGTGKTTIFDAMSFALFGKMPSKDGSDIRSHHAEAEVETFARFRFAIEGVEYVAERRPEYHRPKMRGEGTTKESAQVRLVRIEADGSTVLLASKTREMDSLIDELLGLSAEQFRRVMLLPQGEVAKFLLDDSKDREGLLSNLFDGQVYGRVADAVESEARRLRDRIGEFDELLRHHLKTAFTATRELYEVLDRGMTTEEPAADADTIGRLLDDVAEALAALEGRERDATTTAGDAERRHTLAAAEAERFDAAQALDASIAADEGRLPGARKAAESAERSRIARRVVTAGTERDVRSEEAQNARNKLDNQRNMLAKAAHGLDGFDPTGTPSELSRRLAELREALADERRRHEAHQAALRAMGLAEDALKSNSAAIEAAQARCSELEVEVERLAAEITELSGKQTDVAELEDEQRRLTAALQRLVARDQLAERLARERDSLDGATTHFEEVLTRYVATEAPRLARQLVEGAPCPVCGSAEHPSPAVADDGKEVDMGAVDAARQRRDAAQTVVGETLQELEKVRLDLGDRATINATALAEQIFANEARRAAATELAEQHRQATERHARTSSEHTKSVRAMGEAEGARVTQQRAVDAAGEHAKTAAAAAAGIDPQSFTERQQQIDRVEELLGPLDGLREEVTTTSTRAASAQKALEDALAPTDFADADQARAVLIEVELEASALQELKKVEERLEKNRASLTTLQGLGIPAQRPDVESLGAAASMARRAANDATDVRQKAQDRHESAKKALAERAAVDTRSAGTREQAERARRAADVCSGKTKSRISLRRWVLGRELERVASVASEHLSAMTGGRYTIRRADDGGDGRRSQGLDLEVLDAHTGRPRRPNSLSGGEQFQASLALALGLADVVSHGGTASGRRIDALFIDEGFGSLDPRALDDAIETLHHLHASGRMVGVITHVEAMKERLHAGIVVTRLPGGRGSTLTVNP